MADPIVSGAAVRDDAPVVSDWGLVVRVVGGVVVVGPIHVIVDSLPTGTLANGVETPVGAVAIQILPANPLRKVAFIQNTGSTNIRVGVAGVTATTGLRLTPGGVITYDQYCPTNAIFAIREDGSDSIVFAQEVT